MIVVVDYGLGNLGSVQKAVERTGFECVISGEKRTIRQADKLILPGVGHFKLGMENLTNRGLRDLLDEEVLTRKKPILGICLGMQLMTSFSEEGGLNGLNWIEGFTRKFPYNTELRIPHMGWNTLEINNPNPVFRDVDSDTFFYFVHSFFVTEVDPIFVTAKTAYGINFISAFGRDNIYGCQFHPEKSHDAGLNLIKNFCSLS